MDVSKKQVLQRLPADRGEWVKIKDRQQVKDIIADIVASHQAFTGYYDKIGMLFYADTIEGICDKLYNFCKKNIHYREESEVSQTTAIPAGILNRGYGDCKHYASFIGGCLDAISRETGEKIDWHYCFASYLVNQKIPYHVFVVVETEDGPVWVDPTPGATLQEPVWIINKKIKEYEKLSGKNGDIGCSTTCECNNVLHGFGILGSLSPTEYLNFAGEQTGTLLPSIPGYPPDLPQLQVTPDGRLTFWNWPIYLTDARYWVDYSKITPTNPAPPITGKFSTLDWNGTWIRIGTKRLLSASEKTTMELQYEADRVQGSNGLWTVKPGWIPMYLGKYFVYDGGQWWDARSPMDWIKSNVQYYLNKFLIHSYDIDSLIAYGTGWPEQIQEAIQNGKFPVLLNNINFLAQPTGKKTFWDSFYTVIPIVILSAESLITAGAATPALAAALAIAGTATKLATAKVTTPGNVNLLTQQITDTGSNLAPGTVVPGSASMPADMSKMILWGGLGVIALALVWDEL